MIVYNGTVLNYDGIPDQSGDVFSEDTAIELPSHDVPVTFDFRQDGEFLLGKARLYFRNGVLRYQMFLDENKLPQYALDPLVPAIGAVLVSRTKEHIDEVKITSIGLSEHNNCDIRIRPIGVQK